MFSLVAPCPAHVWVSSGGTERVIGPFRRRAETPCHPLYRTLYTAMMLLLHGKGGAQGYGEGDSLPSIAVERCAWCNCRLLAGSNALQVPHVSLACRLLTFRRRHRLAASC